MYPAADPGQAAAPGRVGAAAAIAGDPGAVRLGPISVAHPVVVSVFIHTVAMPELVSLNAATLRPVSPTPEHRLGPA
jgi:hypothetical protein